MNCCKNPIAFIRSNCKVISDIIRDYRLGILGGQNQGVLVAKSIVDVPIVDDQDFADYSAQIAAFILAFPEASSHSIGEYHIVSDSASDGAMTDAGIDPVLEVFRFGGNKPIGESHFVRVTFMAWA